MSRRIKKSKRKESLSRRIFLAVNTTFLVIFSIICLLPFFNLLAISLSETKEVVAGNVGFVPIGFNTTAYEVLITNSDFWRAFAISIQRVLLGTILSLVINVLAAYPLSRGKKFFKGRQIYVVLFIRGEARITALVLLIFLYFSLLYFH